MKLNVKGLVFVGFAAAVFANAAAFAADPVTGDKIVTSKTYVDNKIAASVTDGDTTHAPSGDAVHNYVKNATLTIKQGDANSSTQLGTFTANQATDQIIYVPTPAAQVQSDWNQETTTAADYIKNKPTIPTVNDKTLTIQKNGTLVGTFTANSATDETINVTVPTKTSDINNDSGFITSADIPAQVQSDWSQTVTTSADYIKNKPELATVATSGSYNDLSNKPTINDATLTIQKNGTAVGTFTANSANAATINITVPTAPDIPTPDANTCTATAPCALVWAGGTAPTWEPIQQ